MPKMQFTYFRIPCQLITHPRFKHLSTDSKLLYGMLLDRMSLSIKNEWYDDTGRVYIYYTVDEICSSLNCGRDKAMKLLAELDTGKGVGLIERKKQGQGKPTRIYVKRFTTQELPPQPEKKPEPPAPPPAVDFDDVQRSRKPTLIKLKEIKLISSSLIHPSLPQPPAGGKWGLIDAKREKKSKKISNMSIYGRSFPMMTWKACWS